MTAHSERLPRFVLRPICAEDAAVEFSCGKRDGASAIDKYLRTQALADHVAQLSSVWIAVDPIATTVDQRIVGFFTLAPLSIPISGSLLATIAIPAAPYPAVGGYLLGRLGVASHAQGSGIGDELVYCAMRIARAVSIDAGGAFIAVDPKNEPLVCWYKRLGFRRLDQSRRRMVARL